MTESRNISEALLLAATSAVSYGVAYAYQAGYASYFGLPPLLLAPTVGNVLRAAGAIGLVVLVFGMIASGIWVWAPRGISALAHAIRRVLAFTLVIGLFAFYVFDGGWGWLAITVALCWQGFFEFVFPLIVQRKVSGYENKLKAQAEIDRNAQQHLLVGRVRHALGDSAVRIAGTSLLIIYLAYFVGIRTAKNQEEFFVLTDRPGAIVAAIDENVVILANYDQTRLSLTGSYQVERLSEYRAWKLQRRSIGKLAVQKSNKTSVTQSGL